VTAKTRPERPRAPQRDAKRAGKLKPEDEVIPITVTRPELLTDGQDRDFRRLVHALFGFFSRHEKIRDGHAKFIGLNGIDYTVLISIAHLATDGEVNVRTVADHLHFSGAFITTVTGRLFALGLIHKKSAPDDKRRVSLSISAEGRALLNRLAPVQRQVNDIEFESLSREDFTTLITLIEKLIDSSERAIALQNYLYASAETNQRS
jgi:MarR family transcriptional regulator, organic hydroperoxide resistance regulator